MKIDPILSLSISMHSNKGIYVLLLGSGLSRSAGIPTGWEIVLDLIRKLAHLKGESCEPQPEVWYKEKFGEDPDYSKLLEQIAKSPSERSQLLKRYFEPTIEERERGLKIPTKAHQAIAYLISKGYIRVIITTNFDRLLEDALAQEGIKPLVISTTDSVKGALPLTHTTCSIIKVNGDYLDVRIKNTPKELSKFEKPLNMLLDRIFDECGLIVCGWSTEWDIALRLSIERCKNHRFTTYWTFRSEINPFSERLIKLRFAETIKIKDADSFLLEIEEKITALEDLSKPHPLSPKIATATLKKYLEENSQIPLHDLLMEATEKTYSLVLNEKDFLLSARFSGEELLKRINCYEGFSEILLALMVTGCFWGNENHQLFLVRCLQRFANPPRVGGGNNVWIHLRLYPALLLLYGGGIATIAAKNYAMLKTLFLDAKVRVPKGEKPLVSCIYPWTVLGTNFAKELPGMRDRSTPLSDRLFEVLRQPLKEYLPDDFDYQQCFDKFEYLLD